ncbi:MAG: hypothetical protein AVDCRST_MAG93-6718 [uncultured Chloroflexia bacterium]|uniref:Uncharacterized protein n=1 Tax=uncultured Chloroflexia bacterium TaxID=1672391 RepID=A0A6J4LVM2_9CHLR|nr:MAG: hypothetical protein AVDCRST_MAG93-6718 [uncultured Chloroflexia bacterium]
MPTTEQRLAALERDRIARYDAWLQTLTDAEFDAEVEKLRRANPDAWASLDAMTLDEINAELAQRGVNL